MTDNKTCEITFDDEQWRLLQLLAPDFNGLKLNGYINFVLTEYHKQLVKNPNHRILKLTKEQVEFTTEMSDALGIPGHRYVINLIDRERAVVIDKFDNMRSEKIKKDQRDNNIEVLADYRGTKYGN